MHKLVVRINGTDAAFLPIFRNRTRQPKVCTSVSLFVFKDRVKVHHTLLDVGPGVCEAIQAPDLFPEAFPIDWLLLSHAHNDHFLGLDALCGDFHWWAKAHALDQARLKMHCLPATFDETVGTHFPFLKGMIEHTPAVPGAAHVLWRDGDAELRVTLLNSSNYQGKCRRGHPL
jgi:glyoxylase-like metal-dependent hydrolase (beta-lactamase superfamily II)